ncbi:MAG: chorismate mutase [Acidobacteria bacterium]|nr:chorismate mutase [Acidobacteriota bacterium]
MKLEEWRNEIDSIDAEITRLVNHRAMIARQIGVLKAKAGLPTVDAEREEAVMKNVCSQNTGALKDEAVVRIFRRIIHESRQMQIESNRQMFKNGAEVGR